MATRSTISVKNPDGTYSSIYCHWDGYPTHHLPILNENYNTYEKAKELINLGAISSLEPKINPTPDSNHSFENKEDGVVVAYHRDRGEELQIYEEPILRKCIKQEYNYIFNEKKWELW